MLIIRSIVVLTLLVATAFANGGGAGGVFFGQGDSSFSSKSGLDKKIKLKQTSFQ